MVLIGQSSRTNENNGSWNRGCCGGGGALCGGDQIMIKTQEIGKTLWQRALNLILEQDARKGVKHRVLFAYKLASMHFM